MAADADLKAAVARVSASASKEIKSIAGKLSNQQGGLSETDAALLAAQLNATADNLDAETAALTAVDPPANAGTGA